MDLHFEIPAGDLYWNATNHLFFGILLPLFRHYPGMGVTEGLYWTQAESTLRGMQKVVDYDRGSVLSKLWDTTRRVWDMQQEMVQDLLRSIPARKFSCG